MICGAHAKQTKQPCKYKAGFRTIHPGTGRCWLHGGATPKRKPTIDDLAPVYKDLAKQFANDSTVFDMRREIGIIRAAQEQSMTAYDATPDKDKMDIEQHLAYLSVAASKIQERFYNITYAKQYAITIQQLEEIIVSILAILQREIKDEKLLEQLAYCFREEIRIPTSRAPSLPTSTT